MKTIIGVYALTAVAFLAVDAVWLGLVAKGYYDRLVGHLLAERVNWAAAFLFYLVYIGGMVGFVIAPALRSGMPLLRVGLVGGGLGLVAYATFDLTCLALLRGWPLQVAVIDMLAGIVLTGGVSVIATGLWRRLFQ